MLPFVFTMLSTLLSLAGPGSADEGEPTRRALQRYIAHDAPIIALTGLKLIDGTGAPARANQTIVIQSGRIAAAGTAGSVEIPAEAEMLDLRGHTAIPGLVGMHNHTHMPGHPLMAYTAPRLYLASGVTTIQTAGSASPAGERDLALAIRQGRVPGPEIIHTGPYITGRGGSPAMVHATGGHQLRKLIRTWVDRGVTWFKVYRHIAPEHLELVIDIAHEHGARVAGHLCSVSYAEAAEMGIDAIEHGFTSAMDFAKGKPYGQCKGNRDFRDALAIDSEPVRRLHQTLIDHDVALTSTLSIIEAQVPARAIADKRSLAAMAPALVEAYHDRHSRMEAAGDDWRFKERWLQQAMAFDVAFFRAGGLLTAGVDPGLHNLPGFGDQRNYELLVEAGLSPIEAIGVMTSNGAEVLGRSDIGRIAAGRRADLVVLNGDLEANPGAIRNVEIVFKAGVGYDPAALLADVEGQVGQR